ncbi:MAG TPA: GAF domain-containing protein [Bacteroidales bacterium]|nr:GAF domain-containing protein [Bacteroidales bacterium]
MKHKRQARYSRIRQQLKEILSKNDDLFSGMATINAILYHKMDGFFWVGFYLLKDGRLLVGPYQGPVACIELPGNKGVCWAGINGGVPVIVPDVHEYPGHIACDPRSKSEIVIPVRDRNNMVIGVLDIDSNVKDNFDYTDAQELERIVALLIE